MVIHWRWSYFREINPAENRSVAVLSLGEGWHNYHHVFPWDYKAAELGNYTLNATKLAIDIFHKMGLAYDLRTVPDNVVASRVKRTGDGTHPYSYEDFSKQVDQVSTEGECCEIVG